MKAQKLNSNGSAVNTSWHGQVITTTVESLTEAYGEPSALGDTGDKVQYEWDMELQDGTVFTIYDWKEYREYSKNDYIEFHIGAHKSIDAIKEMKALKLRLGHLV